MSPRTIVLLAKLEKQKRDLRHLVAALIEEMQPPLSAEAAELMMETAALMGALHKRWLFGKPLSDPERIDSSWPF